MQRIYPPLLRICLQYRLCRNTGFTPSVNTDEPVAELIAYYAKEAFGDYEEGELIVDTNDPINRIVPHSATEWKYEGDYTGEYYSSIIPKPKVEVKKYTMYPLPAKEIKNGITFLSEEGHEAKIFPSKQQRTQVLQLGRHRGDD